MTYVKLATLAVLVKSHRYIYMLGTRKIFLINEKLLYYMLNLMPNFPKYIRYMHRCVLVPTLTSFAICSNRPDEG